MIFYHQLSVFVLQIYQVYVYFPSVWSCWFCKSNSCKVKLLLFHHVSSLCHRCSCNGMFFSHLYTTSCSSVFCHSHLHTSLLTYIHLYFLLSGFGFLPYRCRDFVSVRLLVTISQVKATNEKVWRRIEKRNLAEYF